jgi:hypothetical protein
VLPELQLNILYDNPKRILNVERIFPVVLRRKMSERDSLYGITCSCSMLSSHMRTLTKTRISIAAAFMLAMTASMMFAPTHAESSIRVT